MASTFASARIKGAMSATAIQSFDAAAAQTADIVTAGVDNVGLVAGPLKDLLTAGYTGYAAGVADVAASQALALAAVEAHVRINQNQRGASRALSLIGWTVAASAAIPSKLTVTSAATASAAFATEKLETTIQYAPSLTR